MSFKPSTSRLNSFEAAFDDAPSAGGGSQNFFGDDSEHRGAAAAIALANSPGNPHHRGHRRLISSDDRKRGPFGGRLLEIVVCEFREDGKRTLATMTLRGLYEHVMKAVTNRDETKRWELRRGVSVALVSGKSGSMRTKALGLFSSPKLGGGDRNDDEDENRSDGGEGAGDAAKVTQRERLGGYLHPRDMRRLVTPFSASNAPALMVRRHVMLLNFDPLRAIILRDRVLAVVSKRADTPLLETLERRLKGGWDGFEKLVFGEHSSADSLGADFRLDFNGNAEKLCVIEEDKDMRGDAARDTSVKTEQTAKETESTDGCGGGGGGGGGDDEVTSYGTGNEVDELDDIDDGSWKEAPYELHAVDALLSTVCTKLSEDAHDLRQKILVVINELQSASTKSKAPGELEQEKLRLMKDRVGEMEARINGFVRAMDDILDDDRDMALMNLSRLLTHPDRFVLPLSEDTLAEEASEPEMVLEVYHHQALSMVQALELLKGQIASTEELVGVKMDILRNKLLFLNTMLALAALCVAIASLVGAIFGMNLLNGLEANEHAFLATAVGTVVGALLLLFAMAYFFHRAGVLPRVH